MSEKTTEDIVKLPLILASQSPRRRHLLTEAGYSFQVMVPDESAECGVCSRETAPELVARLAHQKAADVAQRVDHGLVIGCDTVASCCGRILGKPVDVSHARQMLELLRGREHEVYSGICLWLRPQNRVWVEVARSRLQMDPIDEVALETYLDTDAWCGKAGAFGYQDGLDWVHLLEGSESNVVGLPLELLAQMVKNVVAETNEGPADRSSRSGAN